MKEVKELLLLAQRSYLLQEPLVDLEPEPLQQQHLHLRPLRREEQSFSWSQAGGAAAPREVQLLLGSSSPSC